MVTGVGRRRGIGAAICRAQAGRGADIFLTYWRSYDRSMPWGADEDGPETLLEELLSMGIHAEGMKVDLSRPGSPDEILDTVAPRSEVPERQGGGAGGRR